MKPPHRFGERSYAIRGSRCEGAVCGGRPEAEAQRRIRKPRRVAGVVSCSLRESYAASFLRRSAPMRARPRPNSATVAGSGTVVSRRLSIANKFGAPARVTADSVIDVNGKAQARRSCAVSCCTSCRAASPASATSACSPTRNASATSAAPVSCWPAHPPWTPRRRPPRSTTHRRRRKPPSSVPSVARRCASSRSSPAARRPLIAPRRRLTQRHPCACQATLYPLTTPDAASNPHSRRRPPRAESRSRGSLPRGLSDACPLSTAVRSHPATSGGGRRITLNGFTPFTDRARPSFRK